MRVDGTWLWVALVVVAPRSAEAQEDVRWVMHQRLVGVLEPMGAEHALAIGARARLGDPREILFTGTHAEAGVINYTSPIYSMTGGYLQVSPLAFLVLRAEITGAAVWPIGMDGAGYYRASAYRGENDLRAAAGDSASGWNVHLSATLQGAVPLGPTTRLALVDQIGMEHITLGDAPYHFYPRYDLVLARQDWVLENNAMLLVEARFGDVALRAGVYDALRFVPRSEMLLNQAGLIAAVAIEADPAVPEVMPLVRAGFYTNGPREGAFTLLAGVIVRYDLGPLR